MIGWVGGLGGGGGRRERMVHGREEGNILEGGGANLEILSQWIVFKHGFAFTGFGICSKYQA